jgi:hypothetical protein
VPELVLIHSHRSCDPDGRQFLAGNEAFDGATAHLATLGDLIQRQQLTQSVRGRHIPFFGQLRAG